MHTTLLIHFAPGCLSRALREWAANAEKEEGLSIITGEKIYIPTKIAEMAVFIRWGEGHAFMDDATGLRSRPREFICEGLRSA